jgi:putative endonuclease
MPSQKRKFGDIGEKIAEKYLISKGYAIIEKNYLKLWGEIDLVAKKDGAIIFCEVKTRDAKHVQNYLAESSVNRLKIKKLQKICETYLMEKRLPYSQKWQIDVLAIAIDKEKKKARVKHFENAVWEKIY